MHPSLIARKLRSTGEQNPMNTLTQASGIHHFTLTVTNLERSINFYNSLLGFQVVVDLGERKIMSNGNILLVVATPPDPAQAIADDRFSENRVGLDHISFTVASRDELEEAARLFDDQGVGHGEIKDLGPGLGIYVLAFRDPDNIQLELTAPYS
jgi:glyoxylase I family protein